MIDNAGRTLEGERAALSAHEEEAVVVHAGQGKRRVCFRVVVYSL